MSIFFSVITTAYNAQEYILEALNSVRAQKEAEYEYIIVNNGSEDQTLKIIQKFAEENPQIDIKIINFDVNQGISGGRNAGIQKAKGEYICFLDADDSWFAEKLSTVKKAIHNNPYYTVFCHWENHISGNKVTVGKYRAIDNSKAYEDLLFNGNCLSTSALTVKSSIIKNIGGFNTELVSGEEDFDCWLRLARIGARFYLIKKVLGVWNIRNDSISAKHIKHTKAVINMLDKHFEFYGQYTNNIKKVSKKKKRMSASYLCSCGRTVSLTGDRKEGNKMYLEAIKMNSIYLKSYAGLALNLIRL